MARECLNNRAKGPVYKLPLRVLLGITGREREAIRDTLLAHLTRDK